MEEAELRVEEERERWQTKWDTLEEAKAQQHKERTDLRLGREEARLRRERDLQREIERRDQQQRLNQLDLQQRQTQLGAQNEVLAELRHVVTETYEVLSQSSNLNCWANMVAVRDRLAPLVCGNGLP